MSAGEESPPPDFRRPLLALDTGSPTVSVAVGREGRTLAERAVAQSRSSAALLRLVDEALEEAHLRPGDLGAVVVLRGPGSFTGLRVGMATALGFHAALQIPAAAIPTHRALAAAAPAHPSPAAAAPGHQTLIVAAVEALRGAWFVQRFTTGGAGDSPTPLSSPEHVAGATLSDLPPCVLFGFGVSRLDRSDWPPHIVLAEPTSLAPAALRLAATAALSWDAGDLTSPLYLQEPAVTLPAK